MYLEESRRETEHILKVSCFLYKVTESGQVSEGVTLRIGRMSVQITLGVWPGFGIQPHYDDLGDLRVE